MLLSYLVIVLLCSLLHLLVGTHISNEDKIPLHFAYITTKTGDFIASRGIPIVDLALKMINERNDILQNYTLNYMDVLDSGCNQTMSLDVYFKLFQGNITYVTLLGCGCSLATIPVAEISHYWNIPQITYAAASTDLNDRQRFRNFFRVVPSFDYIPQSLVQLMRQFKWKRMAIITQEENVFEDVTFTLEDKFHLENWSLDSTSSFKTNFDLFPYNSIFDKVKSEDYRIIYVNTYSKYAYYILCEAYYRKMYAPTYVWILPMWYNVNWWNDVKPANISCTKQVMATVLNGTIGIIPSGYYVALNTSKVSFSGLTPQQFSDRYAALLLKQQYQNLTKSTFVGVTFDTVWSMAIGLDNAVKRIATGNDSGCEELPGELVPLEEFDYTNEKVGCILRQGFAEVNFLGITGNILFDATGSRPSNVYHVKQYRKCKNNIVSLCQETIAKITILTNGTSTFDFETDESNSRIWIGGSPPNDGSPIIMENIRKNHLALTVIYDIISLVGLFFVAVCLVFNIVFRNKKAIKLSSPNLNYLIIVGTVLMYLCIYLYVHRSTVKDLETVFCNIRFFLFSLGYTLCFAVILSKTWRVYYIFYNPTTQKKALKDWVLFVQVLIIVSIDLIIIVIGSAIPQSQLIATKIKDIQNPDDITDEGILNKNFIYVCAQTGSQIWLAVSFSYKALLQLVAIFLAFHIRRVKIKALNDSKEIAAIIYINSIILALLVLTQFTLQYYQDIYSAMFGLALLVDATMFIGFTFIPKMISLYRDQTVEKIFSDSLYSSHAINNTTTSESPEKIISSLQAKIKELESKLAMKEVESDPLFKPDGKDV